MTVNKIPEFTKKKSSTIIPHRTYIKMCTINGNAEIIHLCASASRSDSQFRGGRDVVSHSDDHTLKGRNFNMHGDQLTVVIKHGRDTDVVSILQQRRPLCKCSSHRVVRGAGPDSDWCMAKGYSLLFSVIHTYNITTTSVEGQTGGRTSLQQVNRLEDEIPAQKWNQVSL